MEREFAQYQEPETVCDENAAAEVMSPEEVFEEAFGELDQLDAAMLQLAPRKNGDEKNLSQIFLSPAPRYSAFSDSRMSLSTLEESTPSLTSRSM